tara:strand:- start:13570 stop:13857 length:288 start_codon:yes stop_codon:yes gene_type:complete
MQGVQPIKLKEALAQMDARDESGMPKAFQISFYPASRDFKHFKRIRLPKAVRCGLPRQHQYSKSLVGVRPLVADQHIYSVPIRLITEFNETPVIP